MADLFGFHRNPNERIDEVLSRFDVIRLRSQEQGQMMMSIQGLSFLLLKAIGVTDQQLLTLLMPFNGNYPGTEMQYQQLQMSLRRMGHVLENNPGNIAQALRGTSQANTQRMFVTNAGDTCGWYQTPDAPDPWQSGADPWSQQSQKSIGTSSGKLVSISCPGTLATAAVVHPVVLHRR